MASNPQSKLNAAFAALGESLARLEAATEIAAHNQAQSAAKGEAAQAEISASWEANLAELQSENNFLKEDNLRLSNQLQQLQRDYLELQKAAGSTLARLDGTVKQLDLLLEH